MKNKTKEEEEKEFLTQEKETSSKDKYDFGKEKSKDANIFKTFDKTRDRPLATSKSSASDIRFGIPKTNSVAKLKKGGGKKKKGDKSGFNKSKGKAKTKN